MKTFDEAVEALQKALKSTNEEWEYSHCRCTEIRESLFLQSVIKKLKMVEIQMGMILDGRDPIEQAYIFGLEEGIVIGMEMEKSADSNPI